MPPLHVGTRFALGLALTLGLGFFSFAKAQDQNQRNVDTAITAAERICLSGNRYNFALKANGDLTIKKLSPGAEVELKVDRNQTRGGTFFDDAQVRQVDQDIRACMQSEWPKVISALTTPRGDGDQNFPRSGLAPQHVPPPPPPPPLAGEWHFVGADLSYCAGFFCRYTL
jgi:hypothetical protein